MEYKYDLTKEKVITSYEEVVNNKSVIIAENRQKIYDNNFTIDAKKDDVKHYRLRMMSYLSMQGIQRLNKLKKLTQAEGDA